jgi:hypothetical protein
MSEASELANNLQRLTVEGTLSRRGANKKSLPKLNLGNIKSDSEMNGAALSVSAQIISQHPVIKTAVGYFMFK